MWIFLPFLPRERALVGSEQVMTEERTSGAGDGILAGMDDKNVESPEDRRWGRVLDKGTMCTGPPPLW